MSGCFNQLHVIVCILSVIQLDVNMYVQLLNIYELHVTLL